MQTHLITKDVHEMTHTPILRVLISYSYENKRNAKLVTLDSRGLALLTRTIKWAAHKGIEIIIRPC